MAHLACNVDNGTANPAPQHRPCRGLRHATNGAHVETQHQVQHFARHHGHGQRLVRARIIDQDINVLLGKPIHERIVGARGSEVSSLGELPDQLVERQIRHRPAQTGVLLLQHFHTSSQIHLQNAIFFAPTGLALFGDADPVAGICNRPALCQHDLDFTPFHSSFVAKSHPDFGPIRRGQIKRTTWGQACHFWLGRGMHVDDRGRQGGDDLAVLGSPNAIWPVNSGPRVFEELAWHSPPLPLHRGRCDWHYA